MAKRGQRGTLRPSSRVATKSRRRRPDLAPAFLLAGAVVVALAILGAFVVSTIADRDWHEVASVNAVSIDRAQLRNRIALDAFLARVRTESIRAATQAGRLTADTGATLDQQIASDSDPANRALDELIDEAAVRQGAQTLGVAPPTADAGAELLAATIIDARLHVRWVTLTAPAPPKPPPPDPGVADALRAGTLPSAIATAATAAGWTASGSDVWLPTDGPAPSAQGAPVAPSGSSDVPASLLVAARSASKGSILGPFTDEVTGAVTTGLLVEVARDGPSAISLRQQAADSAVDSAGLEAWAQAHALQRAVTDHLLATWSTTPIDEVRAAELVLGPPPDGGNPGPYVELGHLVVKQLDAAPAEASAPPSAADIAAHLRSLPLVDRLHRFTALVGIANSTPSTDPLARSGEVGIVTNNNLVPALGTLAFAASARSGDVLGPIQTSVGDEVFLLEARYQGALDDATIAALIAARAPDADLAAMAARIDPRLVARATAGPWRARPEFSAAAPAAALFDTPVGVVADPLVISGELVVPQVLDHQRVPAGGEVLARLRLTGFSTWLSDLRAVATIRRDADPLGSGQPSPEPSGTGVPKIPLETPFLPSLPGESTPRPSANPLSFPAAP